MFAVIAKYSFDGSIPVVLFDDEQAAKSYLKDVYNEELRIDTEENGWERDAEINEDGTYAKITCTEFGDTIEWFLSEEIKIGFLKVSANRK